MGYNGTNVNVFTGRVFISDKDKEAGAGDTLRLTLVERNAPFENAPMLSERITGTTLKDLVSLCAQKYLGYGPAEILTVDPDNYFDSAFCSINVFEVRNESLLKKLKDTAEAFGGVLYNDSDGNLVLRKLFTTTTPDITYTQNHWIKWGIKTNMRNEVPNEIEIIGREKQLDEMVKPADEKNLCVLGYERFDANLITTGGLPCDFIQSHSIQFLKKFKGIVFREGYDEEGVYYPGFIHETGPFKTKQNESGQFESDHFLITDVSFLDKWGIPTEAEIKYYEPALKKTHDVNCEVWAPIEEGYGTVRILSFNKESATLLIQDLPRYGEGHPKEGVVKSRDYMVILYGYAIEDKFLAKKNTVRMNEIFLKTTYEEVKQPWVTNYYSRRILKDPVSGERLSTYTGVIKKETVDLPWIDTDEQSYEVNYNRANLAWMRTRPFTLTVPANPLIERGDLVRVELDDTYWCEFWVETIRHEYAERSTTTLDGFIYQSQLPYDPVSA